jgi:GAF domain-containing protein/ANTAR domain-containing protein
MSADRIARAWLLITERAGAAPVSLAHVCDAAVLGVGVDGAGLTVMTSPTVRAVVHVTDQVAARLEELQLTLGQGPCVDAFAGGPVLTTDLQAGSAQARWPAFSPAALDAGARAVFALPLQIGAIRIGVLDLYRARPHGLTAAALADALTFAETATALALDGVDHADPGRPATLSGDQAVVHQAAGMISVQLEVRVDVAFARLRAYAFATDRRLTEVAQAVVDRRLRFHPDGPRGPTA